uniref:Uncharacterized protein n=1 Tax=Octopus bimaculoides TaxID=37653 RepID=A0A0L8FID8_OCTBM
MVGWQSTILITLPPHLQKAELDHYHLSVKCTIHSAVLPANNLSISLSLSLINHLYCNPLPTFAFISSPIPTVVHFCYCQSPCHYYLTFPIVLLFSPIHSYFLPPQLLPKIALPASPLHILAFFPIHFCCSHYIHSAQMSLFSLSFL